PPREPGALKDAASHGILELREARRVQVLPDELAQMRKIVTAEQRARAVAIRQCIGPHDVREIRVRIRRARATPEPRNIAQPRTPHVVAPTDEESLEPLGVEAPPLL